MVLAFCIKNTRASTANCLWFSTFLPFLKYWPDLPTYIRKEAPDCSPLNNNNNNNDNKIKTLNFSHTTLNWIHFQKPKFKKSLNLTNMNSACKAWIVASSIAAVETLKDQGVCRWNFVIRSMQQHAKNNIRSYYQAKKLSAQSSSAISNTIKRSKEDSIRKVMDLSCWGPNTIRF